MLGSDIILRALKKNDQRVLRGSEREGAKVMVQS